MNGLNLRHHNDCPRCPSIGAEDLAGDEFYELLSLRFNLHSALDLCRGHLPHRVDRDALTRWLEHSRIDQAHIDHVPVNLGPGIMITLPGGCGMPLIDGNHRAARAIREGTKFYSYVLSETETLALLTGSMGPTATHYWRRMRESDPHPVDFFEGE